MTKPWRIFDAVAERDIPAILAYHLPRSRAKAGRILAEYERILARVARHPLARPIRPHGWHTVAFRSGPYLLYYREFVSCWLVAAVFHAMRDPDWIQAQLLIREVTQPDG